MTSSFPRWTDSPAYFLHDAQLGADGGNDQRHHLPDVDVTSSTTLSYWRLYINLQ